MKENSRIRERVAMAMSAGQARLRHPGLWGALAACAFGLFAGPARAAEPTPAAAASPEIARLQAEVDRLKQDMREQRQLILQPRPRPPRSCRRGGRAM